MTLNEKQSKALRFIRNILVHTGSSPSIRDIMKELNYKSPRSAALVVDELIELEVIERNNDGDLVLLDYPLDDSAEQASTIDVPLVGAVACGAPIFAEENIQGYFKVSTSIAKPPHKYFLLKAQGDSMDQAGIKDGDLVLIRQTDFAEEGENIVALIDNEATIKKYSRGNNSIILEPKSSNNKHVPIILHEDFRVQGVVVTTI
ncbi:repressor LexA [Candidatus Dojkabacteria bacterium]|nr:repressor LexA [Candidatus Dojkabacteria bacterium]